MTAAGPSLTVEQAIRDAVLGCGFVVGPATSPAGEAAGGDDPGVVVTDTGVEVHVTVAYGAPIADAVEQIGSAVAGLLAGRHLHVFVDDVRLP